MPDPASDRSEAVASHELGCNRHFDMFTSLDEIVHQRTRLSLLCVLCWRGELDFNTLRDTLELSDGNLARHITVLRAADMVETEKRTEGRRRRTYIRLTDLGCGALEEQVASMAAIVASHGAHADIADRTELAG